MPPTPPWNEQQLVGQLQAGLTERLNRLRTVAPVTAQQAPAQALALIQVLHEAERFIAGFSDQAESLSRQGLTNLANQIAAASTDVAQAKLQYLRMYQSGVQTLLRMDRIQAQAQQFAVNQILAGTYHQQAVVEASLRGIRAAMNHQCATCGLYFGDAYPYFTWCPHCRARV